MYIRHDCVVRNKHGKRIDIEIRSRSEGHAEFKMDGIDKARKALFVILHYFGTDDSWVLPSEVALDNLAESNQIVLGKTKKKKLEGYYNNYDLLQKLRQERKDA